MKWQNVKHWPDVCRVNTSCSCIYLCLIAELQTPPKKALAVDKEFWFLLTAKWTKKGVRHRLAKKALFSVGLLIYFFLPYCSVKIDVLLKKQTWQIHFPFLAMSFVFASSISSSLYPSMKLLYNKGMVSRFCKQYEIFFRRRMTSKVTDLRRCRKTLMALSLLLTLF